MPVFFSASEFLRLSPAEQIKVCNRLEQEAVELSVAGKAELRLAYSDLAKQWALLAEAIAKET